MTHPGVDVKKKRRPEGRLFESGARLSRNLEQDAAFERHVANASAGADVAP